MAKKSTYIKLDRNIQDWKWYTNANTFRVFIHLLLNANIKKHGFEGIDVERGQLVTTYSTLAKELKLSEKNVRTAINHLKSAGTTAVKIYPKFSVITVLNYELYQDKAAGTSAGNRQAIGRQAASKRQQYKNSKNEKNVRSNIPTLFEIASFVADNSLNVDAQKFFDYYENNNWQTKNGDPIQDWHSLAITWSKKENPKPQPYKAYANIPNLADLAKKYE